MEYYEENNNPLTGLEVAVIGMSARFPGAKDINDFWENLKKGKETITRFSDEELRQIGVREEVIKNPNYVKARGMLEDKDKFDPLFFGFTPAEAQLMSPQMRILHECVWNALEHSGYNPFTYKGSIGLYAGASSTAHWSALSSLSQRNKHAGAFASNILTDKDQICTQISYNLNLKGPSFVLQTACSTSLVSIHLACQGLLSGECSMALAGGLALSTAKEPGYIFMEGSIYSPDGYCRPFDEKANGTVESEGVGIVVLKPLEDAMADGDTIHAIICGSAINNDGKRKVGYTAPSAEGQAKVIRAAYQAAGIEPETISYIETHGTGTNLGDPIEIEALKWAFNTGEKGYCRLGSVKSNIGHAIEAAGVASFIKTVLSLKNKQLPPTLHITDSNPKIDFKNSPFVLNTQLTDWISTTNPLRAGVSSFGIGGTNAHVIVEEAPVRKPVATSRHNHLICLSSKTKPSLQQKIKELAAHIERTPDIDMADLAYTLQIGRSEFNFRKTFFASDKLEALSNLTSIEAMNGFGNAKNTPSVCFMFSGQGSQYINMAIDLYQTEPIFKRELQKCFEIAKKHSGIDLENLIYPKDGSQGAVERLTQTENTQPALFAIEYSMSKFLMELGVKPDYLIGHSIGEYVAACISGVFSLEDAIKIVLLRGKLMQRTEKGSMLTVALREADILQYIEKDISIASINTPGQTVVSGTDGAIKIFQNLMESKDVKCVNLHTSHAFHSYLMDPILEEFESALRKMGKNKPAIPLVSNLTGRFITEEQAKDPSYWTNHIRKPVKFAEGLETIMKETGVIFTEVGPGKSLSTFVKQNQAKLQTHHVSPLIRHPKDLISDANCFWEGLGNIWSSGVSIKWEKLYEGESRSRIPLPTYPFDKKRFWIDEDITDYFSGEHKEKSFEKLLERTGSIDEWFYTPTWEQLPLFGNKKRSTVKNTLLFSDSLGIGDLIAKKLQENSPDILTVKEGDTFSRLTDNSYQLNPGCDKDYFNLVKSILDTGREIDTVVHCWNIYKDNHTKIETYDSAQDAGFYSIINLVQAFGKIGIKNKISIKVLSNNTYEVTGTEAYVSPEKATLLGAVKVVPLEYSNIQCKNIDIDLTSTTNPLTNEQVEKIVSEIHVVSDENIVALRSNYRWVPGIKKLNLGSNIELPAFREKGVYLVTGGYGGIGFSFATYIAENYNARIVLVGRKGLPERTEWDRVIQKPSENEYVISQLKKIIRLEKKGAKFLTSKADVSDYHQMQEVVEKAEKEFGEINGIIHAAGVIDFSGIIQNRTREMTELSFAPKVKGPLVLDNIFEGKNLDMFVLFSSVDTYIYKMKFGQVGYNAGNNFLDAFTFYLRRKGINSYTINWSDWLEVGMSLESAKHTAKKERREFTYDYFVNEQSYAPISPGEGIAAFLKVVGCGFPRLAINPCDLVGAVHYLQENGAPSAAPVEEQMDFDRPELDTDYVAPGNKAEELIIDKWCKLFGLKKIGIHDNFFELGGDSLKGMTFINGIIDVVGEVIHVSAIFEAPTAAKFANYLAENYARSYSKINGETLKENKDNQTRIVDKDILLAVKRMIPKIPATTPTLKKKNKQAIFIISPPRTGSTLLRVMLAGHTKLFAPPELDLLPYNTLSDRKNYYANTSGTTDEGPIKAIMQIKGCNAREARQLMKEMDDKEFTIPQFYNQLQEWLGDRILVDKSPGYSTNIDILKRAELYFEDALYIHLLRHPYGMIRSYDEAKLDLIEGSGLLKKLELSRLNLAELSWTIGNENIVGFLKEIPDNRKFRLKFEDLVRTPEEAMKDLFNFIGIEFQEDALKPYKEKSKRMTDGLEKGGIMIGDVKFHKHKEINKDVADTWKDFYKEDFLGTDTIQLARKFGYTLINENKLVPIVKAGKKDYYGLSSAQRRLFILQQIDGNRIEYNIFRSYLINGKLNKDKIEQCFMQLIKRHESLRTSFHLHEGVPVQKVEENVEFSIKHVDAKESEVEKLICDFNSPIETNKAPLIRVGLATIDDNRHVLMANLHHIISDGTSIGILMEEFMSLYKGLDLPDVEIQYKDFSEWQKEVAGSAIMEEKEKYWLDKLSGETPILNLPTDFVRPPVQSFEGNRIHFEFTKELSAEIMNMASSTGTTLYMVLLSVFKVLLGKYSGQEDVIVASPITGRVQKCLEKTVGMFVNTLVIRSRPELFKIFRDYLLEIKQDSLDAFKNQDYQFEELIGKLDLSRDMSRNPLFDVMFAFQNMEQGVELKTWGDLDIKPFDYYNNSSKFDITLNAFEEEGEIKFIIEYCTKLFKESTIERFISHFEQIITSIVKKPDVKISEIDFLLPIEKLQLLKEFNSTESPYPEGKSIHGLFEEEALRSPGTIAVYCGEESTTYGELNEKSDKLAHYFSSQGHKGELIVITGNRTIEMVIGILGILKSGNAYLPIDAGHPIERNQKIILESGATTVLSDTPVGFGVDVFINIKDKTIYQQDYVGSLAEVAGTCLAYVIYTSGSTGTPKGVMVCHSNVVNFVYGMQSIVPIKSGPVLSLTTISFDIFGLELYVPLLNGGSLVLAGGQDQYDAQELKRIVEKREVRTLQLTPSRLKMLMYSLLCQELFKGIEALLVGGEEFPVSLHEQAASMFGCRIYNMYGPTETTIWSTYKEVTGGGPLNIGKPIINTQVYILGSNQSLQPIGVAGELHISGAGVSQGYYKNGALTAKKFIDNPYCPGTKLYRTGDMARWLPDGNIEFLGRADDQVKIRGFRIELGEVESAVSKQHGIESCTVVASENSGEKYLCAYIVPKAGVEVDTTELRENLSTILPDYMVPQYFVSLDKLPLTPNGKVDRESLPTPEVKAGEGYVAPSNATEEKLVGIWSGILNTPQENISITANFFELGGHSLRATNLIAEIFKELGYELSMAELFKKPTIREISALVLASNWVDTGELLDNIEKEEVVL